jgi:hypothetical protein
MEILIMQTTAFTFVASMVARLRCIVWTLHGRAGDMSWNRKAKPDKFSLLFRLIGFVAKAFVNGDVRKFNQTL